LMREKRHAVSRTGHEQMNSETSLKI